MKAPDVGGRRSEVGKVSPGDAEVAEKVAEALNMEVAWGETTRKVFAAFKAAGEALEAKKAALGHGEWIPWLKANMPASYRDQDWDETGGAWGRKARRLMRIAYILNNAHPEAIESAQTIAQLYRLGDLLPEGGGAGGGEGRAPEPMQIVTSLQRSYAKLPSPDDVKAWPEAPREKLRAELEENIKRERELLEALD